MYYDIPLRGDFQVECELTSFGYRESMLAYAGFWTSPAGPAVDNYNISYFERYRPHRKIDPPMSEVGPWYRYRLEVHDGQYVTYINGHKLHEQRISESRDPWLVVRTYRHSQSGFRNLRITGSPTIPDSLNLSVHPDLTGWISAYYGESAEGENADWRKDGEAIVGRKKAELDGHMAQSLLYYHRPMLEDGSIEYEFLYRHGEAMVHPALDRLVFLLQPEGVRIHWLTDIRFDRTALPADNVYDEPANRRGPSQLPLKADDWNRVRLELNGDTVMLALNGEPIYERNVEPTNMRNFGLFHYADRTEARVRNVTYRGDWPRALPPVEEQKLAVDPVALIERHSDALKAVYRHDFKQAGAPERLFRTAGEKLWLQKSDSGIRLIRPGGTGWPHHTLAARIRLRGDFDVTASFVDLKPAIPEEKRGSGAHLYVVLDSPSEDHASFRRRHNDGGVDAVHTSHDFLRSDGNRAYDGRSSPSHALSGKFRLVRIGSVVYYMFAEADSNRFQLLDEWLVGDEDTIAEGIRLCVQNGSETLPTEVTWTDLTVRADEIITPQ